MLVTALNPVIGYDNAAKVAKRALLEDISLEQAAIDLGSFLLKNSNAIFKKLSGLKTRTLLLRITNSSCKK
jgi:fumarate hydratase class II